MSLGEPIDYEYLKTWWEQTKAEFPHYCLWHEITDVDLENPEAQKQILKGRRLYECGDMYCRKQIWSKTIPSPFDFHNIYQTFTSTVFYPHSEPLGPLEIQDEEQQRPEQED